jgi:hypothetical protein
MYIWGIYCEVNFVSFCEIFPIFKEGNQYRETAASALIIKITHLKKEKHKDWKEIITKKKKKKRVKKEKEESIFPHFPRLLKKANLFRVRLSL